MGLLPSVGQLVTDKETLLREAPPTLLTPVSPSLAWVSLGVFGGQAEGVSGGGRGLWAFGRRGGGARGGGGRSWSSRRDGYADLSCPQQGDVLVMMGSL